MSNARNGNKLVDYEAESSDEDYDTPLTKPYINGNHSQNYSNKKESNGLNDSHRYYANGTNGFPKTPTPPRIVNNGESPTSRNLDRNTSASSSRASSPNESNRKWHNMKQHQRPDSNERKVYTKANAVNKGWHVCKDSPTPSSSYVATNDWSVSDNFS